MQKEETAKTVKRSVEKTLTKILRENIANDKREKLYDKISQNSDLDFIIEVAKFKQLEKAHSLAVLLRDKGYLAQVHKSSTKKTFHVQIQGYKTLPEAMQVQKQLKKNEKLSVVIIAPY